MKSNTEKALVKIEDMGLSETKAKTMLEKTPIKYIKKRKGRGNQMLDYVEAGYVISKLNETFNYMWSFEIVESKIENKQISVLGKLTAYIVIPTTPPMIQAIIKSQYGGSDIKTAVGSTQVIDTADDFKAAASDSLKKCASLFGIAQDVYWKSEKEDRQAASAAPVKTAADIVYKDTPNTAKAGEVQQEVPTSGMKMATESQKTWIKSSRDKGTISLTDKDIDALSFEAAVQTIGQIRKALGK